MTYIEKIISPSAQVTIQMEEQFLLPQLLLIIEKYQESINDLGF